MTKELLYRVTKKIGIRNNSSVLVANAYHHRSDVWASIVALVGLGGAYMGYVKINGDDNDNGDNDNGDSH